MTGYRHAPSRLPMNKLKSLLQKTRKVTLFVWKSIRKNTPLSSEIYCYVKSTKGLHLKGLCQLESMRSEVMQITFNCQNSIVFNA